jgi:hypothetical protein
MHAHPNGQHQDDSAVANPDSAYSLIPICFSMNAWSDAVSRNAS